jgi:N-acyl homoserine lactone hydrolase
MAVYHLPTGVTHRSAGFAYRGGSLREARDFAMSAALVRHPRGDVLIDTGFGRNIDAQFKTMPWFFRAATSYERGTSAADQVAGVKLRSILLTHAHWDHASGIADFPGVPVLVTAEEETFIRDGGWISRVARESNGTYERYRFEGGPYLGFPRSHDLYGDGAIVVVPAPGHTPGSVIVFVSTTAQRYAFVGDLAWQREGITELQERPWLMRRLADGDADEVRASLRAMNAIVTKYPQITLIPAHDARAFATLPKLEH